MVLKLIDVSCLVHIGTSCGRSAHYNVAGFPTGGMYEVLRFFRRRDFNFDDTTVFCFDRHSNRKTTCAEYKSNRKPNPAVLYQSMELEKGLKSMGFNTFGIEGYESDDLIYSLAKKYHDKFDAIEIYATDRDLAVLVDNKTSIISVSSTVPNLNISNFKNSYKAGVTLPYNATTLFKIIFGDSSDNIKGLLNLNNTNLEYFYRMVGVMHSLGFTGNDLNTLACVSIFIKKMPKDIQARAYEIYDSIKLRYIDLELHSTKIDLQETQKFFSTFRMKSLLKKFNLELIDYGYDYIQELSTKYNKKKFQSSLNNKSINTPSIPTKDEPVNVGSFL